MALEVLQSKEEYKKARLEMQQLGIDCADRLNPIESILESLGKLKRVKIGDIVKSWDILKTIQLIEKVASKDSAILDIGAVGSEILLILNRLNYQNLTGLDLGPKIEKMPAADKIRYINCDFMHTPFEDNSFQAITSISVIEHGFNGEKLFSEISRILVPGGYFIASFDYFPEKIDTSKIRFFDLDWMIFSKEDVQALLKQAEKFDLRPVGHLNFAASKPTIKWQGKNYTFAWLALQKADKYSK